MILKNGFGMLDGTIFLYWSNMQVSSSGLSHIETWFISAKDNGSGRNTMQIA